MVRANKLGDMQLQEAERKMAGRQVLSEILQRTQDPSEVAKGLFAAGYPEEGMAFIEHARKQQKDAIDLANGMAQLNKSQLEQVEKTTSILSRSAGAILEAPEEHRAGLWQHFRLQYPGLDMPEQYPGTQGMQQLAQAAVDVLDRAKAARDQRADNRAEAKENRDAQMHPVTMRKAQAEAQQTEMENAGTLPPSQYQKRQLDEMIDYHKKSLDAQKAGQDLTRRGQNMTDNRARELADIRRDQKPATEAENRSWGFYTRARQAEAVLATLEGNVQKKNWVEQQWQKHGPNSLQSDENQSYDQAKRQWVAAYLRRDSGAVISPSEFDDADKTYFVQPGDGQQKIEQKRKARAVVIQALKVSAGRAIQRNGEGDDPPAPGSGNKPPLSSFEGK
jgi:hypothetical protein